MESLLTYSRMSDNLYGIFFQQYPQEPYVDIQGIAGFIYYLRAYSAAELAGIALH